MSRDINFKFVRHSELEEIITLKDVYYSNPTEYKFFSARRINFVDVYIRENCLCVDNDCEYYIQRQQLPKIIKLIEAEVLLESNEHCIETCKDLKIYLEETIKRLENDSTLRVLSSLDS